ncbi:hypothetical protein HOY80DRAFT_714460 [Tuber brumale]|nr:hypothetical protein HOY80DRAFT_714460 [Tuber brumale]
MNRRHATRYCSTGNGVRRFDIALTAILLYPVGTVCVTTLSHDVEVGPKNYDINRNRAVQHSTLLLPRALHTPPSTYALQSVQYQGMVTARVLHRYVNQGAKGRIRVFQPDRHTLLFFPYIPFTHPLLLPPSAPPFTAGAGSTLPVTTQHSSAVPRPELGYGRLLYMKST